MKPRAAFRLERVTSRAISNRNPGAWNALAATRDAVAAVVGGRRVSSAPLSLVREEFA
jgi:hypothetical protein